MNELVPSVSIDNLVAKRDAAAERIRAAHKLLAEANDLNHAFFGDADTYEMWRLTLVARDDRRHNFTDDDGADKQIKTMDAHYWNALLERSGLRTFMDAATREAWNEKISNGDVPELTRANIKATFAQLHGARGEMFEAGVVKLFERLSWDYKTNAPNGGMPRKLGKRLVFTHMVDVMGGRGGGKVWLQGISHDGSNKLDDLVRVMSVLDGKPEPDHRDGAYYKASAVQWMRDNGPHVFELHGYASLRGFKNRNAHLTFLRPDLIDALNAIIAKHYPNALPPASGDA